MREKKVGKKNLNGGGKYFRQARYKHDSSRICHQLGWFAADACILYTSFQCMCSDPNN